MERVGQFFFPFLFLDMGFDTPPPKVLTLICQSVAHTRLVASRVMKPCIGTFCVSVFPSAFTAATCRSPNGLNLAPLFIAPKRLVTLHLYWHAISSKIWRFSHCGIPVALCESDRRVNSALYKIKTWLGTHG
jgi:hypothetical protein